MPNIRTAHLSTGQAQVTSRDILSGTVLPDRRAKTVRAAGHECGSAGPDRVKVQIPDLWLLILQLIAVRRTARCCSRGSVR